MRCYRCGGSVLMKPDLLPNGEWVEVNKCISCGREQGREEDMAVIPKRICKREECGKEYQPTSNVQKFCPDCAEAAKLDRAKRYRNKPAEKPSKKEIKKDNQVHPHIIPLLFSKLQEKVSEATAIWNALKLLQDYAEFDLPGIDKFFSGQVPR